MEPSIVTYAREGNLDLVRCLLERKVDPDCNTRYSRTALMVASGGGCHTEIIELLIANKADVNYKDVRGATPLHWASYWGQSENAKILLRHKAEVGHNKAYVFGAMLTPLMACTHFINRRGVTALLVEHKADPNQVDSIGYTPLHGASCVGDSCGVRALLRAKAVIDRATRDGRTPLACAVARKKGAIVKILLEAGADVKMDEAILAKSSAEIREMVMAAGPPGIRRAKLCWRSWARVLLRPPAETDTPQDQLRAFFAEYPGLRRQVGAKVILYSAPT